jgi:hypothetical protein
VVSLSPRACLKQGRKLYLIRIGCQSFFDRKSNLNSTISLFIKRRFYSPDLALLASFRVPVRLNEARIISS